MRAYTRYIDATTDLEEAEVTKLHEVNYQEPTRDRPDRCTADGLEIEKCNVDSTFIKKAIYMELPRELRELSLWLRPKVKVMSCVCSFSASTDSSKRLMYGTRRSTTTSRIWDSRHPTLNHLCIVPFHILANLTFKGWS
ncbi:hypothetical protein F441_10291 [Phytophthora nicotianae CJ01A1]|uniref:Uncharacterized protein n=1 Tax=Phytophthora nicotianae CJ01A1 TaxID=1317063 RepID=W2WWW1_PHYNI|nr:hypothetical protein F441_10291 [Phytophthora nicotianae CJ01A1]